MYLDEDKNAIWTMKQNDYADFHKGVTIRLTAFFQIR